MIKIIDNYLNEKDFNFVHSTLNDEQFLWEWRKVAMRLDKISMLTRETTKAKLYT